MFQFCIRADRALGEGIEEQLVACMGLHIQNIETSAVIDGIYLEDFSGSQVEHLRSTLIGNLQRIVLLDCDFFGASAERINLLFRRAMTLGVESVSIALPEAGVTLEALNAMLAGVLPVARSYGIGVLLENRRASLLDTEAAIAALFREHSAFEPGLIFNPLEFAAQKRHPFFHMFYNSRLKPAIRFLRINDGLFADGSPALPALGNAEIKELTSALLARSFRGYFSFHPYLPGMDVQLYQAVIERFKGLLREM